MLSIVFVITLCLLASGNINGQSLYPTSTGSVGAIYTMSNAPDTNQVLIYSVNASGQLTMSGSISTNGTGINSTATDPLFSQGSVVVYDTCLFVVNSGSNSLSMFMINTSDATKLTLISVQSSFGFFPMSVAVNSMYACVLTSGNITGIRCFTYNSSGMFIVSSFDRNLTSYISQTVPPSSLPMTFSQISFSADNLALIVAAKGSGSPSTGYLLFYPLTNSVLGSTPTMQVPANATLPFSITLVNMNGLLLTDPGIGGVITLNYSSTTGMISNSVATIINATLSSALCWSTYSPSTGNYYVVGANTGSIAELSLNLGSTLNPVTVVKYYQIGSNIGALDATVITLAGTDYLYVIGPVSHQIVSLQLRGPGNALTNGMTSVQSGSMTSNQTSVGIAGFVQMQYSSTSTLSSPTTTSKSDAVSISMSMITIIISILILFFY